jgi:hypothetical protein
MPEALVVVAVFAICVAAWIGAWMQSRNPALHDPEENRTRLCQQERWLRQRLELAQREGWSADMIATLAAELEVTRAQRRASDVTAAR